MQVAQRGAVFTEYEGSSRKSRRTRRKPETRACGDLVMIEITESACRCGTTTSSRLSSGITLNHAFVIRGSRSSRQFRAVRGDASRKRPTDSIRIRPPHQRRDPEVPDPEGHGGVRAGARQPSHVPQTMDHPAGEVTRPTTATDPGGRRPASRPEITGRGADLGAEPRSSVHLPGSVGPSRPLRG